MHTQSAPGESWRGYLYIFAILFISCWGVPARVGEVADPAGDTGEAQQFLLARYTSWNFISRVGPSPPFASRFLRSFAYAKASCVYVCVYFLHFVLVSVRYTVHSCIMARLSRAQADNISNRVTKGDDLGEASS